MTGAREKLATAISNYDNAVAAAGNAKETLEKARDFVADLESQVESFKALDKEIAASRAAGIECALRAGETPTLEASPELVAELVKKQDAEKHLAAARQAVSVFEERLTTINQTVDRLGFEKERAAGEVLASEAEEMATAFASEFEALRSRYFVLHAITSQRVLVHPEAYPVGTPRHMIVPTAPVGFSREVARVVELASVIGAYQTNSHEQQVRDRSARAVDDFFSRLKSSASATIADSLL
jgi:exonuclease VII small subunit